MHASLPTRHRVVALFLLLAFLCSSSSFLHLHRLPSQSRRLSIVASSTPLSSSPNSPAAGNAQPPSLISEEENKLRAFLADCASLGAFRFVVVGQGAILEAVGSFSNLRYADSPKGRLATVSTDEPCFECHIRLHEVKSIANVKVTKFNKQLCVTRFLAGDGTTLLSAILHASSPPTSSPYSSTSSAAVVANKEEAFDALIRKWGEKINLASPAISSTSSTSTSTSSSSSSIGIIIDRWLKLDDSTSKPLVDVAAAIADRCEKGAPRVGLEEEGLLEAIVNWFKKHSNENERVAAQACRAFTNLAFDNADNKAKLGQAGVCQVVLETMSKHASSVEVATQGFMVLSSLAYNENNRILMGRAGASRVVLDALKRHSDNYLAAERGIVAIRCLCWDSDLRFELCQSGACELLLEVMNADKHVTVPALQMQGCLALGNLANENAINKATMGQVGACETIVRVMKIQNGGGLVPAALQALFSLANDDNNQFRFGRAGSCPLLLQVMKTYATHPQVVEFGCIAVYNLAWNTDNKRAFLDAGAVEYLTLAAKDQSLTQAARDEALNALTRLQ